MLRAGHKSQKDCDTPVSDRLDRHIKAQRSRELRARFAVEAAKNIYLNKILISAFFCWASAVGIAYSYGEATYDLPEWKRQNIAIVSLHKCFNSYGTPEARKAGQDCASVLREQMIKEEKEPRIRSAVIGGILSLVFAYAAGKSMKKIVPQREIYKREEENWLDELMLLKEAVSRKARIIGNMKNDKAFQKFLKELIRSI